MPDRSTRLRVAAFTGGTNVPSARFRIRQLMPALRAAGVLVDEHVPRIPAYPPRRAWLRPAWGVGGLLERLPSVLASHRADLVVFQRELLSTLYTCERWAGRPRVLDVDDAVFLLARGDAARRLASSVDLVVCGNDWLADHYRAWNADVAVVPTAVDTARYRPRPEARADDLVRIGWSGTAANLPQLRGISGALRTVLAERPGTRLRVVSDRAPVLPGIDPDRVDYVPWSREVEVGALQGMDIGVMPLADEPWTRGKCSYKMLLSMACGLPVVVSPVGMNREVLARGDLGRGAATERDWIEALLELVDDRDERLRLGGEGRRVAAEDYSIDALAPRVAKLWRRAAGRAD